MTKRPTPLRRFLPLLVVLPLACRDADKSARSGGPTPASSTGPPSSAGKLPFIDDDYARAVKDAKTTNKPVFVDVWASWCHSCMSMKQYVFPAAEMRALTNTFTWLSIDSEKAVNADFLERFPSTSLPTVWVIDPTSERAVLKWVGAATAPELASLLGDAARARNEPALGEAASAALRGDQAVAQGKAEEAVTAYREALASAPLDWARRPRVIEALSLKLLELERHEECVDLAVAEIPRLRPGTPLANLTMNALSAATDSPAGAPAKQRIPLLVREGARIVDDRSESMLIDDRSGLYLALVGALDEHSAEAKRLARAWADLLEGAAAHADSAESRAVWDAHRLEAYMALDEVEKAIPMLEESARNSPDDYNPPARLARAYFQLRRYEPALIEVTRAKARAYGPRKLRIYMLEADILEANQDRAGARRAIGEALEFANKLRLAPNYQKLKKKLAERYAALE